MYCNITFLFGTGVDNVFALFTATHFYVCFCKYYSCLCNREFVFYNTSNSLNVITGNWRRIDFFQGVGNSRFYQKGGGQKL